MALTNSDVLPCLYLTGNKFVAAVGCSVFVLMEVVPNRREMTSVHAKERSRGVVIVNSLPFQSFTAEPIRSRALVFACES